jgi:glycosyltransferase involved in cell wall biosynthesis
MRILKVTQAYFPFQDRGGPAIKIRSIAQELVKRGNHVTVLTADLGFGASETASAAVIRNGLGWRSELGGVEAIYLKTKARYRSFTINPLAIGFCRHRLQEFNIVHIYGLYDFLGPVVAKYCRRSGIPYFIEPLGMTRAIDRGFFLKKIWNIFVDGYLGNAFRLVATSELELGELLADGFPAERVLLRYNGIDLDDFSKLPPRGAFRAKVGVRAEERLVIFLGRLIPRKGADLLIEALKQSGCENLKLVIAGPEGENGYLSFLRGMARNFDVERRVFFTGPLYGDDKKSALADADMFALPSRYENFGNAAAEAIACGTPVIVTDRCGIASLIDRRAGVVTSYDSGSLAQALRNLLVDEPRYQRLKAGCSTVASEISWVKLVRGMQDSYEDARNNFLRRPPV